MKTLLAGASADDGAAGSGGDRRGQPSVDVEKLWKQMCEDPSFDRRRRQIGRRLTELGVPVKRK